MLRNLLRKEIANMLVQRKKMAKRGRGNEYDVGACSKEDWRRTNEQVSLGL